MLGKVLNLKMEEIVVLIIYSASLGYQLALTVADPSSRETVALAVWVVLLGGLLAYFGRKSRQRSHHLDSSRA